MRFIKLFLVGMFALSALSANAAFINFDNYTVQKFDNQGADGTVSTSMFGLELGVNGNTWVYINDSFNIDASSVLYFSFEASGTEAEWYGIGFDNDNKVTASSLFQFGGTDTTGANQLTPYIFGSGIATYAVNVGDFLSGAFSQLVFVLDADNVNGTSSSFFNVELCSSNDFCATTAQSNNVAVNAPSSAGMLLALSLGLLIVRRKK